MLPVKYQTNVKRAEPRLCSDLIGQGALILPAGAVSVQIYRYAFVHVQYSVLPGI